MTDPKPALPIVAWIYKDGEQALQDEGCGLVYLLEQQFSILPHEEGRPLADHASATSALTAMAERAEAANALLRDCRTTIRIERDALAEAHANHEGVLDPEGKEWVDDFDALLARIDAHLSPQLTIDSAAGVEAWRETARDAGRLEHLKCLSAVEWVRLRDSMGINASIDSFRAAIDSAMAAGGRG